jgi:hypothetical protein
VGRAYRYGKEQSCMAVVGKQYLRGIILFHSMLWLFIIPSAVTYENELKLFIKAKKNGERLKTEDMNLSDKSLAMSVNSKFIAPSGFNRFGTFFVYKFELSEIKQNHVQIIFNEQLTLLNKRTEEKVYFGLAPLDIDINKLFGIGVGVPGHYDDAIRLPLN